MRRRRLFSQGVVKVLKSSDGGGRGFMRINCFFIPPRQRVIVCPGRLLLLVAADGTINVRCLPLDYVFQVTWFFLLFFFFNNESESPRTTAVFILGCGILTVRWENCD